MTARCDHGHARLPYRWYRPASAGRPSCRPRSPSLERTRLADPAPVLAELAAELEAPLRHAADATGAERRSDQHEPPPSSCSRVRPHEDAQRRQARADRRRAAVRALLEARAQPDRHARPVELPTGTVVEARAATAGVFVLVSGTAEVSKQGKVVRRSAPATGSVRSRFHNAPRNARSPRRRRSTPVVMHRDFCSLLSTSPQIQLKVLQALAERLAPTSF